MRATTDTKRLESRVAELLLTLCVMKKANVRLTSDRKYAHSQMEKYRNKNMQLAAAQEVRAGSVSKIESESMYKKEAGTAALWLERYQPEDRAE
eukprot:4260556-Prymnesium_polylepis.1